MRDKTNMREAGPELIDPFSCRMWECHDRLHEFINETSCREVIESFQRDGQKHPALARPSRTGDGTKHELIYGARRLFAARHLNMKLLAWVKDLDDPAAFVEMDVENRLRRDLSPYERGMSFKGWLRGGYFRSQEELARTLGLSTTQVSRLMRFSDLPTAVVAAFPDPRQIRESWAVTLAERCADTIAKDRLLATARSLHHDDEGQMDSKQIYKVLLESNRRSAITSRVGGRDDVVRSAAGLPLFRVSYRHNDLHIIIRRQIAPADIVKRITEAMKGLLDNGSRAAHEPANGAFARGIAAGIAKTSIAASPL